MPAMRVASDDGGSKSASPPSASMTSPAGHASSAMVVVGVFAVSRVRDVEVDDVVGAEVTGGDASSTHAVSSKIDTMHGTRRRTTTG